MDRAKETFHLPIKPPQEARITRSPVLPASDFGARFDGKSPVRPGSRVTCCPPERTSRAGIPGSPWRATAFESNHASAVNHHPCAQAKPPGAEGGIPKPDFTFTADPSNENSASTEEIMRKIRNSMPGACVRACRCCADRRRPARAVQACPLFSFRPSAADSRCRHSPMLTRALRPPASAGAKFNYFDKSKLFAGKVSGRWRGRAAVRWQAALNCWSRTAESLATFAAVCIACPSALLI